MKKNNVMIEYRYIKENDLGQYITILKEFFGENYYGAQEEFINWQYKKSIFQKDEKNYSILAAFENDKILAIDAYLPWKFYIDGVEYDAVWDIEWLNNSRTKGLGRKLVSKIAADFDIYCGYGFNSYSKNAYEKMNFLLNDEIERKIAFLDKDKCLDLFANENNIDFITNNIVDKIDKEYWLHESIDNLSNNYWKEFVKNHKVVSYKGLDYLQWRFLEHPYMKYKIISSDKHGKDGIAVLRLEQIKDREDKIIRIVDLIPVKGKESALIDSIITFSQQYHIVFIDFYCISYSIADIICPKPFVSLLKHKQYGIPMLFQPMELRERKSINFVLNNGSDQIFNFEDIYATKADSDQDVYLNHDYKTVLL